MESNHPTQSSPTPPSKKRNGRTPFPKWAVVLITILVSLLVLMLAVVITVNAVLNQVTRPDIDQSYFTEDELMALDLQEAMEEHSAETTVVYPELNPSTIRWTEVTQEVGENQELVHILLIGQDARPGETRARSDSMILVTFNQTTRNITLTSFLRDLYVQIPGYEDNRINAAYAFGGMELLDATLEQNFGVTVDANIAVNFDGFSSIIDVLGGVDIDLTDAEAQVLGLSSGSQRLTGAQALSYSRIRMIDSDFQRTARQRNVITSLFHALKSASLTQITELINTIFPLVTTDMSNGEIVSYVTELFPMLATSSITSNRIPADDTYSQHAIRGMSVLVADMDTNRDILRRTIEQG